MATLHGGLPMFLFENETNGTPAQGIRIYPDELIEVERTPEL